MSIVDLVVFVVDGEGLESYDYLERKGKKEHQRWANGKEKTAFKVLFSNLISFNDCVRK